MDRARPDENSEVELRYGRTRRPSTTSLVYGWVNTGRPLVTYRLRRPL